MSQSRTPPTDPAAFVESLDSDAIAARLDEIHREQKALQVLYKAARARERVRQLVRRPELPPGTDGGPHAA